jgi:hypothetical protein
MTDRTTASDITFVHPFALSSQAQPLDAGTYRLFTEEEQIRELSFIAYRRISARLEIPAISVRTAVRQSIQVDPAELEAALAKDAGRDAQI